MHVTVDEMKTLFQDANKRTKPLAEDFDKLYAACTICASLVPPKHMSNISPSNISASFITDIQVDFSWCDLRGRQSNLIRRECNFPCTKNRRNDISEKGHCIYQNGSSEALSADPDFCTQVMQKFLTSHTIRLHNQPDPRARITYWKGIMLFSIMYSRN